MDFLKISLGKLSYLNNFPVYYGLEERYPGLMEKCRIIEGTPRELNQIISDGQIDLSVVSSIEYAKNAGNYLLLPDLSISSDGKVQSVLLFSRVPKQDLHRQPILLSGESETSVGLIKILFSHYGLEPVYIQGRITKSKEDDQKGHSLNDYKAVLIIGDRALAMSRQNIFPFVYDLGEEWQNIVSLPFVFALWVVRREVFERSSDLVYQISRALKESCNYNLAHLEALIKRAQNLNTLPPFDYCNYFRHLRYELSPRYQEGLKRYYHFLYSLGQVPHPVQSLTFLKEV